eukprot:8415074-Lingulodinium_polyedra.AAC.1
MPVNWPAELVTAKRFEGPASFKSCLYLLTSANVFIHTPVPCKRSGLGLSPPKLAMRKATDDAE